MVASNERERKRERERESESSFCQIACTQHLPTRHHPDTRTRLKSRVNLEREREREQIYQIKSIALVMCLGILNSVGAVSLSLVSVQAAGCELLHIVRSINLSVFVKVFFTFFAL